LQARGLWFTWGELFYKLFQLLVKFDSTLRELKGQGSLKPKGAVIRDL